MSGRPSAEVSYAVKAVLARGLSVTEASRKYGVHPTSVRRHLRAIGIPPEKPGRKKTNRLSADKVAFAVAMYLKSGCTVAEAARKEGCHPSSVRRHLRALGIPPDKAGRKAK
jgi:transposase-like protein